jgi:hypothetical protein
MGRKVVLSLVSAGIIGLVAWPCWCLFGDGIREYFSRVPFDSSRWKNADLADVENPVRLRMVDDLLEGKHLVGMPQAEIDELLGTPTQTGHFKSYDYVYRLGPERGFISIDSEWLVIKFDKGVVKEAKIRLD